MYITGKWQHDIVFAGADKYSVFSRITAFNDAQIDHHAQGASSDSILWTEIDVGEGDRIWEQKLGCEITLAANLYPGVTKDILKIRPVFF